MSENDLFGAADAPESMTRPLAVRMRPRTLDEVIGQTQVLGQGSPLRRLANPASKGSLTAPSSVILFGPPGVGKTTLATIVAGQSGRVFEELSAVTSGVKDVRDVLTRAHERLVSRGQETVLFIDEVHRFSKSQQDALLPAVENRDVFIVAATTENPSFSIIIIGVLYGGIAGFLGGKVDNIMMRIVDILYSIPTLIYVVLLMSVLKKEGSSGMFAIIVAMAISSWVGMARIVRGDIL